MPGIAAAVIGCDSVSRARTRPNSACATAMVAITLPAWRGRWSPSRSAVAAAVRATSSISRMVGSSGSAPSSLCPMASGTWCAASHPGAAPVSAPTVSNWLCGAMATTAASTAATAAYPVTSGTTAAENSARARPSGAVCAS